MNLPRRHDDTTKNSVWTGKRSVRPPVCRVAALSALIASAGYFTVQAKQPGGLLPPAAVEGAVTGGSASPVPPDATLPRTADGKPNLQGIWQVRNRAAHDLENREAKDGLAGTIPYQPWALAKRAENYAKRATADPLSQCYLPGVPRIM